MRPWNVEIQVEGLNIERFVRQAGENGILLTRMERHGRKKLTALVREDQLPGLQSLCAAGGWTIRRGRRQGVGRAADWLRKRWLLASALMMGLAAILLSSGVMWQVQVVGAGTYAADVRMALEELGIHPPMLRSQVELGTLRDALEWRYPRVAWVEVGWRGTTLVVRLEEGVLPRKDNIQDGPCDVVASRDAIVEQIITRAGTPVVKPGDFVRQGDVLIRGEERTSNGEVKPVAAAGSVTGRAWKGALVEMSCNETNTEYTGNTQNVWTVRTPWFDLWQLEDCPYQTYDVAVTEQAVCGIFLPVRVYQETRMEAEITTKRRDVEALQGEADQAARRKLQEKLSPEESLIDIWGNCSMIEDEKVQSLAIGELLVEIGVQRVSSGMAAPAGDSSE